VGQERHSAAQFAVPRITRRLGSEPARRIWLEAGGVSRDLAGGLVVVIAPLLLVIFIAGDAWDWHTVPRSPVDFHIFWTAGRHYLHRQTPYGRSLSEAFVYPPPAALFFAPLGALPYHVAAGVFLVLSLAAVVGALWLLGVRDRRLYAAAFVSPALLTALSIGTITPLLILGLAAVWRLRNHRVAAVPAALLLVFKLFLWPVLVWLVVTRRFRASIEAVALSVVLTFGTWAWIGFADLGRYPSILDRLARAESAKSYALARGRPAEILLAALVVAALWFGSALGERRLFALAVVGALVACPIMWLHDLALLGVVVAVLDAPFVFWLVPAALWLTPIQASNGEAWRISITVGACLLVLLPLRRAKSSLTTVQTVGVT
jgi:hypothetical protein